MAEPFTIYKLTILYMLEIAETALSNTQLSNFFLEQDLTNYFNVQEALSELQDAELVTASSTHRNTHYQLSDQGRDTLHLSRNKLNSSIRSDVRQFLREHRIAIREENSATARYYRNADLSYNVCCRLCAGDETVLELTLLVPDLPQAQRLCAGWQEQSGAIYHDIIARLAANDFHT